MPLHEPGVKFLAKWRPFPDEFLIERLEDVCIGKHHAIKTIKHKVFEARFCDYNSCTVYAGELAWAIQPEIIEEVKDPEVIQEFYANQRY